MTVQKKAESILGSCQRLLRRFARNERGNVMIIFAAAALPMAIGVAGALEISQYSQLKSQLQDASDRAALSAMAAMREGPRAMRRQARLVMKQIGDDTKGLRGASSALGGRVTGKGRKLALSHRSTIRIDGSMTGLRSFVSDRITVTSYVVDRLGDGKPPRLAAASVAKNW